jgi:hypothetical protein
MNIEEAVDLAIGSIAKEGLTDIFDDPYELEFLLDPSPLAKIRDNAISSLKQHNFNHLVFKPISHVLMPKSGKPYDYRRAALISPACTVKYLALAILAAPMIEQKRIPVSDKIVFSYRFEPHQGSLFSEEGGYNKWREEITKIRSTGKFPVAVKCDLSSFYDNVNLHRLESTLRAIGVDAWIVSALNDTLSFWSKRDSYGLPVGSNASRILAEAVLIDVDNYLVSEEVKFVRFVDDYRIFAENPITAQRLLALLISRLFREGLYLNASKTSIYPTEIKEKSREPEKSTDVPDPERVLREFFERTGRYHTIPRRYKRPSTEEFNAFKKVNIKKELEQIRKTLIVEFETIKKLLISVLAQQRYNYLVNVDDLISRCIYGVDYIIDMIGVNAEDIPPDIRARVAESLGKLLSSGFFGNLEWYEYKILTLLGNKYFFSKKALVDYFRNVTKEKTELGSFTSLELLFGKANRTDVKTIRELYDRVGEWEKRRIMRLVAETLPKEEAKAWFRAVKPSISSDVFTEIAFEKYRPK